MLVAADPLERGLAGWSDADLFAAGVDEGCALLTENVSDFARIAAPSSRDGPASITVDPGRVEGRLNQNAGVA